MTIEQKAREIAERSAGLSSLTETPRVIAARLGIIEGLEMAAKRVEEWLDTPALLLACGEMTAQEIRTAKAVLKQRAAAIRSLK